MIVKKLFWAWFGTVILMISDNGVDSKKFPDWLVSRIPWETSLKRSLDGNELILSNGLIERRFRINPGFVTIDYFSYEKKSSLIRALGPEAVIGLDGVRFNVGGVVTSIPRAYLNRTALEEDIHTDPNAFQFFDYDVKEIKARFPYKPKRGAPRDLVWPPRGLHLEVKFSAPAGSDKRIKHVIVTVNYEMYDGCPIMAKWVSVKGSAAIDTKASIEAVEILHLNWQWSQQGYNWLIVQNDEPHGNLVNWYLDPMAQDLIPGSFQPIMNSTYNSNFEISLHAHGPLESFRVMEILVGSGDRERQGLAKRKLLRLLAPHTQENPIYFHITNASSKAFRHAVDQLAEVGFEMILYSFGSGWNLENDSTPFLENLKSDVAYANAKGIEVGGYDLISLTRKVKPEWRALDEKGHDSGSACFASDWYDDLLDKVLKVISKTKISVLETDGPYGGYSCSSKHHKFHVDQSDSVFWQNKLQADFFLTLRQMDVYINQPDNYFYHGGSKTGMGYNEHQYSLPRWMDLSVSRQGFFDDTFHYTPTVGWMFLPIEVYHGGGEEAKFEPLLQNLKEYEWGLAQYLGAGIAACYRGTRIFDSDKTKAVVKKWVDFYKKHRSILISDIIHVRRGDMQSVDAFLHVNPFIEDRALAMIFNPTDKRIQDNLNFNLYYAGIQSRTEILFENGQVLVREVDRDYDVEIEIDLEPRSLTWVLFKDKSV